MRSTSPWILLNALLLTAALDSLRADAAPSTQLGIRTLMTLGTWSSQFQQSDGNHSMKFRSPLGAAIESLVGANIGPLLADVGFTWYIPTRYFGSDVLRSNEASGAIAGITLGVAPPFLPIEVFGGMSRTFHGLSSIPQATYSGLGYKVGAAVFFTNGGDRNVGTIGLKAEYQISLLGKDGAGRLPANVSTRADTIMIGLQLGNR